MPRCTASTKSGTRCKLQAMENCKFCSVHLKTNEEKIVAPRDEQEERAIDNVVESDVDDVDEVDKVDDVDDMDHHQPQTDKNDAYITQLINRIVSLELEVSTQKQTISQMTRTPSTSNVSNPEVGSKPKKTRKPRQYIWTNERIEQKARWLFYHEHKKDNVILQAIYTRLAAAGVMYNVTVRINGAMQEQPFLPWQYIKKTCDNMFDELPQEEKQNYMHQVVSMLN